MDNPLPDYQVDAFQDGLAVNTHVKIADFQYSGH
jgi:hypothetical protein